MCRNDPNDMPLLVTDRYGHVAERADVGLGSEHRNAARTTGIIDETDPRAFQSVRKPLTVIYPLAISETTVTSNYDPSGIGYGDPIKLRMSGHHLLVEMAKPKADIGALVSIARYPGGTDDADTCG
jgi:hypothetical protein